MFYYCFYLFTIYLTLQKLVFSRGNLAGEDHWVPAIAYVELLVMCSFPSSITLIANELGMYSITFKHYNLC